MNEKFINKEDKSQSIIANVVAENEQKTTELNKVKGEMFSYFGLYTINKYDTDYQPHAYLLKSKARNRKENSSDYAGGMIK